MAFFICNFKNGLTDQIERTHLRDINFVSCSNYSFHRIKFENIFTAFLVLAIGLVLAVLITCYEYYYVKWNPSL